MAYVYLMLSVASSLSIALMLRHFEQKGKNRTVIVAANYLTAGTLGYFLSAQTQLQTQLQPSVVYLAAATGFFFAAGFILLSYAIKTTGITSTVTVGRLSLAIPVGLSIFLWNEKPAPTDIIALALIFLIIFSWEGKIGKISPALLSVFLVLGINDSVMKYFKLAFPQIDNGSFLVVLFFSAMGWSLLYLLIARRKPKMSDTAWGLLLGVPNFFSTYFLLKTLRHIPAYVVFPIINVTLIMLSALLGVLLFKEKIDRKRILLILMGIVAVVFLSS